MDTRYSKGTARSIAAIAGCLSFVVAAAVAAQAGAQSAGADTLNGFDVSNATIPKSEILRGGPQRDGIPALLTPKFDAAEHADWLKDADIVIGLERNGEARAYPLRILVWHELVNDTVGGDPVLVSYCPLCGTAMVFERTVDGRELTFGVSGLLYQSDVLMYDHQTESLWSQLDARAVSGPMAGTPLPWIASHQMTWAKWKQEHPDTAVLSPNTGYPRNYSGSPYEQYGRSDRLMFPVPERRDDLPRKAWVVGVVVDGTAKAYPIEALRGAPVVEETVGDARIRVEWDEHAKYASVYANGELVPSVRSYWFAWQAFYPDTLLYSASE